MDRFILCSITVFVILSVIASVIPFEVHGDGFSSENVYANLGNRTMAMSIKVNPPIISLENLQDRYLQLRFYDAKTNSSINNLTFWVNVTKGNQKLMYDLFYTKDGTIELKFKPGGTAGQWTVYGNQQPQNLAWYTETGSVDVQAPILSQGGMYHFNMELLGFDYPGEFVPPYTTKIGFDSYLSVGDSVNKQVSYNSKGYNTTIVSFFDKVQDINFDPPKLQFSWSMPFDWNPLQYQNKMFLVHEELRIPNSFKEFIDNPTFLATVNGIPLDPNKRVLDPYSIANTTILHLFVSASDIQEFSKKVGPSATTMNFIVSPTHSNVTTSTDLFTDFGAWQIKLGWSPPSLSAGTMNNLQVAFFNQLTGEKVVDDVTYDLKILDIQGGTITSKLGLIAKGGTDVQPIDMPGNGMYKIIVSVKSFINNGISDTSRTGTARGNLVIPSIAGQEVVPEFPYTTPILLVSIMSSIVFYMIMIKK